MHHCESYGWNTLNIYSPLGLYNWNISIKGCKETQNLSNSITSWDILCGSSYTSPINAVYDGKTCDKSNCNCVSLNKGKEL